MVRAAVLLYKKETYNIFRPWIIDFKTATQSSEVIKKN